MRAKFALQIPNVLIAFYKNRAENKHETFILAVQICSFKQFTPV